MLKRSRSRRSQTKKLYASLISGLVLSLLAVIGIKFLGPNMTDKVAVADTQETTQNSSQQVAVSGIEVNLLSTRPEVVQPSSSQELPEAQQEVAEDSESSEEEFTEEATSEVFDSTEYEEVATNYYSTVLANGNSAGAIGAEAAARMAAATGVPQETWEYIIARESNGDPNVVNPSGAAGLFQTIPGWGSTATVEDQINTAIHVYNNQGLAAWGMP